MKMAEEAESLSGSEQRARCRRQLGNRPASKAYAHLGTRPVPESLSTLVEYPSQEAAGEVKVKEKEDARDERRCNSRRRI